MTQPIIALAIPHTPWIPARAASFGHLIDSVLPEEVADHFRVFNERESNRVWPSKMWRWALDTDATHLVQLQDDVTVAPNFWAVLDAMIEAQPGRIIGLHANHPLAPVQHQAGRRWYRDRWLTGPAYVFPRTLLAAFVAWCDLHPDLVEKTNEDSLISYWCTQAGIDVWHPVPTITDVDQGVPSTYGNDDHHEYSMHRRPRVTWRDAVSLNALEHVDYWRCTEESAPLLPGPGTQLCWFCNEGQGKVTSPKTGARVCIPCVANILSSILQRAL